MAKSITAQSSYHFRLRPQIKRDLARLNLSQNKLATLLGITSGFLSQLLSGKRFVGPETRQKIMQCLPALEFDQLFEEVPADESECGEA